ncbi:MAG: thrombospondin type 3 repeat-containing protein [Kofleriaceae bacterium]|nr:thrombospondin type 3 repeat-containing protein [Kofleriaceae bacterium]
MRALLLGLVLSGGCHRVFGVAADTDDPLVPDSQAHDSADAMGTCTEPVDLPPVDDDQDSVADEQDNCPHIPNTDQHDEDGDALGDACDLCPAAPEPALDADCDRIGDTCAEGGSDPNVPGPTTRVFVGFGSQAGLSTFASGQATVALEADQLHLNALGGVAHGKVEARPVLAGSYATRFTLINAVASGFELGLALNLSNGSSIKVTVTNDRLYVAGSMGVAHSALTLQQGTYTLRVDISGLDVVAVLSGLSPATVMTTLAEATAPTELEVNASAADVEFAYVEQLSPEP